MNKNLLCCAMLGALSLAQTALAQDAPLDDRWYLTGSYGLADWDSDRNIDHKPVLDFGLGRYLSKNWALDFNVSYANPELEPNDLHWSMYGIGADARWYFVDLDSNWRPYLKGGLGYGRHENDYENPIGNDGPLERKGGNLTANLGLGFQGDYDRLGFRFEIGPRFDFDSDSAAAGDSFEDWVASVGVMVKLGDKPEAAPAPAPAAPAPAPEPVVTCADLDDDGDGVNNCEDKCPASQAGQAIGPDGCPVPITIDLRGVNFDFDKATLRPDAVTTLDEAIEVLAKYPDLKVEVAGHTDAIGSDDYNQKLSEKRAQTVFDYLTAHGISAGRLVGPVGYGESRPIAPNKTDDGRDNPDGRAQNRRTELNVQN